MAEDSTSISIPEDPFQQSFSLLLADGTPFNVTLADLEAFNVYNVRTSINYGSQIGATLLLLVVLAILTRPEKRRTALFIINVLALIFNFVRSLLQALYFTGAFSVPYAYFAGDYSRVPSKDYANSVAANVFTLFVLILIEFSLLMQVKVVCATMRSAYRHGVILGSLLVALIAVGFRLALVIENSRSILKSESFASGQWLASATNITTTISICLFCAIFVVKLGVAMRERKRMRLRQYGPMRILFIMGCQTLFIPSLFAILQYFTKAPELGTNVLTLVAIFLPLSSTWAAASINGPRGNSTDPESQERFFRSRSTAYDTRRHAAEASEAKGSVNLHQLSSSTAEDKRATMSDSGTTL